jgi:TetR/AcrR family transcriptional repressor of nem operon
LNTAVDTDDGNRVLRERAQKALEEWRSYVARVVAEGIKARQIEKQADAQKVATLLICSLEGAVMLARLTRSDEPLRVVRQHLDGYLDDALRAKPG